ncbi:MAG: signal peptide peptidase SppA [Candidatus Nanohaloarchaea archaeon]
MNKQLVAAGLGAFMVALLIGLAASDGNISKSGSGTAAIVKLSGSIKPTAAGGLSPSGITPSAVRKLNDRAMEKNPDAVIYEINSGGGAVVASKEVKREIESVKVPTVCRFRDVSASGAYLISLGCDRIVADSASLTGSIGVRSGYLQYSGLLQRYGVRYVNISAGKHKTVGSPFRNATPEEKRILEQKVDDIHAEFVSMVSEERNLTREQVSRIRTGEPFLGDTAADLGLVDRIGGRDVAVRTAENLTSMNLTVRKVSSPPALFGSGMFGLGSLLEVETGSPIRAEY